MKKALALLAAVAIVGACDSTSPRVPTAVEVDQQSLTVGVGQTVITQAVVVDQDGRPFDVPPEGFTISWSSSEEAVALVFDGEVFGVSSGVATVTARAGDLPPADVLVQVEGTLEIVDGVFDLPVLAESDEGSRSVDAQIAFSYSGHSTGAFDLDETFALADIAVEGDYAFTFHNLEFDDQDFVAWQHRADGLVDHIQFFVDAAITEPGSYQVYFAFFVRGQDFATDDFEDLYVLDVQRGDAPGTLTVTATNGQMTGTFSMSMEATLLDDGAAVVGDESAAVDAGAGHTASASARLEAARLGALRQLPPRRR